VDEKEKVDEKEEEEKDKEEKERQWAETKEKIGRKCKILNDRFYFNYCWHYLLLTASPLSIAMACQFIAPNALSLPFSFIFGLLFLSVLISFLRYIYIGNKPYMSTRYCMLTILQTLVLNVLAVVATAQIYIATACLLFLVSVYIWNKVFMSKKAASLRRAYQLNEIVKCLVLLLMLIGYANRLKWSPSTFYHFSWILILTSLLLIVLFAVQATRHFFDEASNSATTGRHTLQTNSNSSQSKKSNRSKREEAHSMRSS